MELYWETIPDGIELTTNIFTYVLNANVFKYRGPTNPDSLKNKAFCMYATLNVSSTKEPIFYDAGCAGAKGFVCAVSEDGM
jgi:hypothetical protein